MGMGIGSFAAVILLGVASVFRSCGTEVVGLVQDPGFTYVSAVNERMVIGGVVYSIGPEEIRDAIGDEATNQLRITFLHNRDDLRVLPVGTVLAAVGDETLDHILYHYERGATLEERDLETLREGLSGTARYIILSRIEEDYVYTSRKFHTEGDEETLELGTHRRVSASFHIYDLEENRTAWHGVIQETDTNPYVFSRELPGEEGEVEESTWVDVVLGVVVADPTIDLRYPDPPNLQQVLPHIFAGFADHLPRLETSQAGGESGLISLFKSGS
jgi:hypothetical protein